MRKESTMGSMTVAEAAEVKAGKRRIKMTNIIVQNEREREKNTRRSRRKSKAARIARRKNRMKH